MPDVKEIECVDLLSSDEESVNGYRFCRSQQGNSFKSEQDDDSGTSWTRRSSSTAKFQTTRTSTATGSGHPTSLSITSDDHIGNSVAGGIGTGMAQASTSIPGTVAGSSSASQASYSVIDGIDIETCTDVFKLNELLDNCNDYETRRQIRARIKTLLTDIKGVQGEGGLRGHPGADGNDGEVGAQGPPDLPINWKKFEDNKKERLKLQKILNCICHFTPVGCLAMVFEDVGGQFFNTNSMIHELRAKYEVLPVEGKTMCELMSLASAIEAHKRKEIVLRKIKLNYAEEKKILGLKKRQFLSNIQRLARSGLQQSGSSGQPSNNPYPALPRAELSFSVQGYQTAPSPSNNQMQQQHQQQQSLPRKSEQQQQHHLSAADYSKAASGGGVSVGPSERIDHFFF